MKNVGTWTWNEEAEEFVWSPQMCAIMGRDPGKARLSKAEAKSFYPSDIWQQLQDALHNTVRHGTPFEIEYQLTSAKGEIQWLQQRGILNTDKQLSNAAAIKHASTVRGMVEDISTTKQVNQRFQNSNHDLMNLIDALPVCISYIDKEYRYQFANKTYERWFGYDKTEVIGLKVSVVVGEQAFEKSLPHLSRALTGEFVSFETYMKYVTGNDRWVTIELYPDMDIDGVRGVYAFVQDISQQKKSEEQYKQNEELWKMALEVSGDGVWDWYPQTGVEILSPRLKEIYGYGGTDINDLSEELDKRTHPEDLAQMYADRQAHFDGLTPIYLNEHRVQCKDGTWKWILTRGTVIQRNAQGLPVRVIGTHTDISERKNAETALQESAERLRMALLANHQGLYDLNVQTGVTIVNEEYANMLGYTVAEMNETSNAWFARLHPDDVDKASTIYQDYLAGKIPEYRVEIRQKTRTGEWRWLQSIGTIVERDHDGKPLRMVGTHLDITERKNAEAMIWQQANIDTLTGLPNRRMFYDRLEQDIKKSKRNGRSLAVLFIDLDHFKEVNDTLGHSVGDILLVEAAKRLLTCVRESDTVARLGGDEFTVSLPDQHNPEDVEQIAQSIIKKMSSSFQLANEEVFLSASIGITLYPDDAVSLDDLLKNADQAMYAAKNAGRNRFNYFTPSLQVAALARLRLGSDLRIAIAEQQLSVYFQPIIDLNTGIIQKAEALIRWQHPQRGFISPLEFIAIAETSDLIFDIGETVFKASVRWLQRWRNLYPAQKNFQISINQSPVEFQRDGSRYANWINHLHEAELPGQAITIEITEGLLLDASTLVSDKLLQFRDAGMQVALDDFGTGYSSLSYLKKFDIDYLKIDQSFVRNMTPGSSDSALAEAIIVMAHKLGLKVIAEGVETEEQRDLLKQAGCDFAQGYLFSRPIPPEDFERLLAG
ncbi:EAL domain-containing protein [Undibacterium sp. RTI2.1]|uniref:EAL domain-containing protein n=1 Tax=unclassified Undibacterium TaxID=2630295 RepID=UPI002AB461CA|nr:MULTISPECIES: EAL domain-containing protein [unclassified Undibacterium]MDY7540081.1 EAL domain-containing protein [Undibacterium sp. 5I1]MEB0031728.1 EAL domain-containing protein [Undibacterium sp. RTI2.1]MEB0118020.1 EAL domain-containing protein [Undibacterium sp. RTI2.2]MEB0231808.1 EAL domain-containing protein [Undibacterium sp. 10I3]MEB0259183.1 EAL domain-containing protein [Undibacterium sp. 5I1]